MIDIHGKDQSWWPDLSGQTVAILASGPSMTREQCDAVRQAGWYAIAINWMWHWAPWADALYACDPEYWDSRDMPDLDAYQGLRIIGYLRKQSGRPHMPPKVHAHRKHMHHAPVKVGPRMVWDGREIGAGSNSAFQATNWAIRCGAKRAALFGVDCHSPGDHCHGTHAHEGAQPHKASLMQTWIHAWTKAAPEITRRGVKIINCSPGTALNAFPKATLDQAIEEWGQVYAGI